MLSLVASIFAFLCFSFTKALPFSNESAIQVIHTFPNETWIENLAIRKNGKILCTSINRAAIYQVNPYERTATLVHQFPFADMALGIAEVEDDAFAVVTASLNGTSAAPASARMWKVDMVAWEHGSTHAVELVANLTNVGLPIGVTTLPDNKRHVLVADSAKGIIWRVNTETGAYDVAIADILLTYTSPLVPLGVNGIHILDHELYFTNTGAGLFGKVMITANGSAAGPVQVIAKNIIPDDFALAANGTAYIVGDSTLWEVSPAGQVAVLAGPSDPAILGDTSAHFGRTAKDSAVLNIVTNGGRTGPVDGVVHGGQLLAVNVRALS
ncbi:hypothetical protein LTR85_011391 [Meristemomyces frigidus]|nr:hypothetical protein LTR85_011391 [Meristemomyces frigidus]